MVGGASFATVRPQSKRVHPTNAGGSERKREKILNLYNYTDSQLESKLKKTVLKKPLEHPWM